MEKKTVEKKEKVSSRIGFNSLYKVFRVKTTLHFLLVIIVITLFICLSLISSKILGERGDLQNGNESFNEEGISQSSGHSCSSNCSHENHSEVSLIKSNINNKVSDHHSPATKDDGEYGKYLPFWSYCKEINFFKTIGRRKFIAITLSILFVYSLSSYFSSLLEKEIAAESYFYLRNILFKKLWKLGLEQKKKGTHELRVLLENEVEIVSELWEHLRVHLFESVYTTLVFSAERFVVLKNTNTKFLFFFFLLVFLAIHYKLSNYAIEKYEVYRKMADEELLIINKQISNAQLIENMGLTSFYEELRNKQAEKTLLREKRYDKSVSFLVTITRFFPLYYRELSLLFASNSTPLRTAINNTFSFMLIFNSLKDILDCFKEYGRYKLACSRIDSFLNTGEREENLEKKTVVGLKIEEILLTNVDFKYSSNEELVLANYSRRFSRGAINRITAGNGTGKTTILYLILGIIKPLSGEVLIKFSDAGTMNLHEEINLYEWREKIATYLSHDNLIEDGSTGQKQLKNISKALVRRKDSQVFIFDESANALDSEKQEFVAEELRKMMNEGKTIIFVQHKTNLNEHYDD